MGVGIILAIGYIGGVVFSYGAPPLLSSFAYGLASLVGIIALLIVARANGGWLFWLLILGVFAHASFHLVKVGSALMQS